MKKKMTCVFILVLCALGCATFREFGQAAAAGATAAIPEVREGPGLQGLGIHIYPRTLGVANATQLIFRVAVYDKEVGTLNPGEGMYDYRNWEPLDPWIPIVALGYAPDDPNECVAAAGQVSPLSRWGNGSLVWTIQAGDLHTRRAYSRQLGETHVSPAPVAVRELRRVNIPREWWRSAVGVQTANISPYTARLYLDATYVGDVAPCEVRYTVVRQLINELSGQTVQFTARYFDQNNRPAEKAPYSFAFYVQSGSSGPYAYQVILE